MNDFMSAALQILAVIIIVPIAGGLISGIDRKISAKMQGRKGPPILQPFYDVLKLLQKDSKTVNPTTRYFLVLSLIFNMFNVVLFFMGAELLLCIFAFTISCVFFSLAGYSSRSPYSFIGAERELVQIICYVPMIILLAFGYYQAVGSFSISYAFQLDAPAVTRLPLLFIGLLYVITIKLRKSPFDISMSHHAHQEIVRGVTTEMEGSCLAIVEVSHWFETVFTIRLLFLFLIYGQPLGWVIGIGACLIIYFLEILVDNATARIKYRSALRATWIVVLVLGFANLAFLSLF
ncbi:MAG: NADH-quinone oxidoreductase subunit H [Defluviitaleaceae bacterium]|nr:NADH-quinone oxidoreductase subunit H [Defluviitaleaceae bacterium]